MRRAMVAIALLGNAAALPAADIAPCQACHTGSTRQSLAPSLDGQHAEYLVNQLTRFRGHVREAFPMDALSQGLDDHTIDGLAKAFSRRDWLSYEGRIDAAAAVRGGELARQYDCAACHGVQLRGGDSIPRLAGQQPDYLARQIAAFGADDRYHPPTGSGARMYTLDAAQVADIAAWLASQR